MSSTLRRGAVGTALLTLALTGCGDDGGSEGGSGNAGPGVVELVDLRFVPEELTVEPGTTVTWQWTERLAHNVVATGDAEGEFASEIIPEGTFEHTFDEPGEYPYLCSLHPGMEGTIVVE